MKTHYSWQAWAAVGSLIGFVLIFAWRSSEKTEADRRVASATENIAYYTRVQAFVVKDLSECYSSVHTGNGSCPKVWGLVP